MGAGGFHGRVRDGIGCGLPAMATRSSSPSASVASDSPCVGWDGLWCVRLALALRGHVRCCFVLGLWPTGVRPERMHAVDGGMISSLSGD
jgi:hypothetical protein